MSPSAFENTVTYSGFEKSLEGNPSNPILTGQRGSISSEWIDSIFSQGFGQNTQSSISTQNGKSDRVHLVFLRHAKSGRKEKKKESLLEIPGNPGKKSVCITYGQKYVLRNTSRVVPELKFNFEVTCVTHAVIHYKLSHLLLT